MTTPDAPLSRFAYEQLFAAKFTRAHKELDRLRAKVHRTKGILFRSHIYSVEELLNSQQCGQIYALMEKVGADAASWYQHGNLPEWGVQEYLAERDRLEKRLDRFNAALELRRPTWWENVRGAFVAFRDLVLGLLPRLVRALIGLPFKFPQLPTGDG